MEDRNTTVTSALQLLNSLARDLDHMLGELTLDQQLQRQPDDLSIMEGEMRANSASSELIAEPKGTTTKLLDSEAQQTDSAVSLSSEVDGTALTPAEAPPGLAERVLLTQPLWCLPGLSRSGAENILQRQRSGTFVARRSSRGTCLILSVRRDTTASQARRWSQQPQAPVEHLVVHVRTPAGRLSLETSERAFDTLAGLVTHYCTNREESPVPLRLPDCLLRIPCRRQLCSVAARAQEFWTGAQSGVLPSGGSLEKGVSLPIGDLNAFVKLSSSLEKECPNTTADVFSVSSADSSLEKMSLGSRTDRGVWLSSGKSLKRRGAGGLEILSSVSTSPEKRSPTSSCSCTSSLDSSCRQQPTAPPSRQQAIQQPCSAQQPALGLELLPTDTQASSSMSVSSRASLDETVRNVTMEPSSSEDQSLSRPQEAPWQRQCAARTCSDTTLSRLRSPELVGRLRRALSRSGESAGAVPPPPPPWSPSSASSPAGLNSDTGAASDASGAVLRDQRPALGAHYRLQNQRSAPSLDAITADISSVMKSWSNGNVTDVATVGFEADGSHTSVRALSRSRQSKSRSRRWSQKQHHIPPPDSASVRSGEFYFCSSVADKISDYEDIWASPARDTTGDGAAPLSVLVSEAVSQASRNTAEALLELAREAAAPSPLYAVPADALKHHAPSPSLSEEENTDCDQSVDDTPNGASPDIVAGVSRSRPVSSKLQSKRSRRVGKVVGGVKASAYPAVTACQQRAARRFQAPTQKCSSQKCSSQRPGGASRLEQWRLDSSWEFLPPDHRAGAADSDSDGAPTPTPAARGPADLSPQQQARIVRALIRRSLPQAVARSVPPSHSSEYDNVRQSTPAAAPAAPQPPRSPPDETQLSKWNSIMRLMNDQLRLRSGQLQPDELLSDADEQQSTEAEQLSVVDDQLLTDCESFVLADGRAHGEGADAEPAAEQAEPAGATQAESTICSQLSLLPSQQESLYGMCAAPPRLHSLRQQRRWRRCGAGAAIRAYLLRLAADDASTFALCVFNFLKCTREGSEMCPLAVMRNVRQFVGGMKNYLVRHGEAEFHAVVQQERRKLSSTEFLDLDVILEGVLEELVVAPLHAHICRLWHDAAGRSGAAQRTDANFSFEADRAAAALGLPVDRSAGLAAAALEAARRLLAQMRAAASPLLKLESLLSLVAVLFQTAAPAQRQSQAADVFLPLLVHTLLSCHFVGAEFEVDYMLGLLHPPLLSGEAGYYLTMLSSAVHVINHLTHFLSADAAAQKSHMTGGGPAAGAPDADTLGGLLRVLVPDEQRGTILSRAVPVRPTTTARHVCRMLDHRLRITSPQDYALFKLINGEETLVAEHESPQRIQRELRSRGVHCRLAYKRLEAKIAWPTAPP